MKTRATLALVGVSVVFWALGGCGSRTYTGEVLPPVPPPGAGQGPPISGVIDLGAAAFVVGPGETRQLVGHAIVRAAAARIEGSVLGQAATRAGADGAGLSIQTTGNIVVTGRIVAANGMAGSAEQDGGDGGGIALVSTQGSITIVGAAGTAQGAGGCALWAGDGGDGGDGQEGGAGGDGGSITLSAERGTITIRQTPGLFRLGDGGDGGDGVLTGYRLRGTVPVADTNNDGGQSGWLTLSAGTLAGVATDDEGLPLLKKGTDTGGIGGDGGDRTFESSGGYPDTTAGTVVEVHGGDGGDGWLVGGAGGDAAVLLRYEDSTREGRSAVAHGGHGGSGGLRETKVGMLQHRGATVVGGHGGGATALGSGCENNGMAGGSAEAVGGSGGSTPLQGDPEPGNGGSAEATGAPGGPGKHGLPGQPGGRGYDGGAATARGGAGGWLVDTRQGRPVSWTWGGRGGDAAAFGGNGGCGGNGYPPDLGGAGGKATAIAGNGGLPAEHVYARDGDRGDPGDSDPPWPIEW